MKQPPPQGGTPGGTPGGQAGYSKGFPAFYDTRDTRCVYTSPVHRHTHVWTDARMHVWTDTHKTHTHQKGATGEREGRKRLMGLEEAAAGGRRGARVLVLARVPCWMRRQDKLQWLRPSSSLTESTAPLPLPQPTLAHHPQRNLAHMTHQHSRNLAHITYSLRPPAPANSFSRDSRVPRES